MTKITWGKSTNNGVEHLLFFVCSAMKNTGRESASTLFPTLNINSQIGAV